MKEITNDKMNEYLEFARDLSVRAGEITMRYFRKDLAVEFKQDRSPVTVADRETETYIREAIQERYPDHGIIGEEQGRTESASPFTWVVDPIDGTKSFIHGIPLYTVLLALLYNGEPVAGVIHNPPLDETVYAAKGHGCFFNGAPCMIKQGPALKDAWVQVTDPADMARSHPEFTSRLLSKAGFCRTWADAYGYLLVATGRADVMIDPVLALWDVAPLQVVITEAGGRFTDFRGEDRALGASAIAAAPALHKEILGLLE